MAIKTIRNYLLCALVIILPAKLVAAPTDGIIHWSETDKSTHAVLSEDLLSITSSAGQWEVAGVRGNRPIYPGEGFYYFEINQVSPSAFNAGIMTAEANLTGLGEFAEEAAYYNHYNRVVYNGDFSDVASVASDTVGIAVDYRGSYPIVHFIGGAADSPEYIATASMEEVSTPVYFFITASDYDGGIEVQHQINTRRGSFVYDPVDAIESAFYRGGEGLEYGWPIDNEKPELSVSYLGQPINKLEALGGELLEFEAEAVDQESGNISTDVNWFLDGVQIGAASNVAFSITTGAGEYQLEAQVEDAAELISRYFITVEILENGDIDSDYDGLTFAQERMFGTSSVRRDTDGDGAHDGEEYITGTNPNLADSDADGISDAYEINHSLNPLLNDALGDFDGDGFSNLAESQYYTNAADINDYPGLARVVLNNSDAAGLVSVNDSGLSFSVESGFGALRSDVAIESGSGWHYFEATRLQGIGDFGVGVTTSVANIDITSSENLSGLVLSSTGNVFFNSAVVQTFAEPRLVETYGVAIDYASTTPVAHIIIKRAQEDYEVLPPIELVGLEGALHILAYDAAGDGIEKLEINTGENKSLEPFQHPVRYLLYRLGNSSAEFMREGWGVEHSYKPLETVPLEDSVYMVKNERVNNGLTLSEDLLGVSYTAQRKSAVLANQGMVGEFRYWEAQRHTEVVNIGFGFNNPYAFLDPYCCVNQGLNGGPPSMSVNAVGGIWRNLQFQQNIDDMANTYYYGFAVDYRAARPIVYVITQGQVVGSLILDDFITEIYPMLYGDGQGPRLTNSANFGAEPFQYDSVAALQNYGVNVDDFVPGWGIYNQYAVVGQNPSPLITSTPDREVTEGDEFLYQVIVSDLNDTNVTQDLSFVLTNAPAGMSVDASGRITWLPASEVSGSGIVTLTVTDGGEFGSVPAVQVFEVEVLPIIDEPEIPPAVPDEYEMQLIGTAANESLFAADGINTSLSGMGGDDVLNGSTGNDYLEGGLGQDSLYGGVGNDIYYYNLGDGSDTITDYDDQTAANLRSDTLLFAEGIRPEEILLTQNGNDLEITLINSGETITVVMHFYSWSGNNWNELSAIEFSDGTTWSAAMIRQILLRGEDSDDVIYGYYQDDIISALAGSDEIYGLEGNDQLFGGLGDDSLFGDSGDDSLVGGLGNDFLQGGEGDDRYIYSLGDGSDVINAYQEIGVATKEDILVMGEGITLDDLEFNRRDNHLDISFPGYADVITIFFHYLDFEGEGSALLNGIEFSNGMYVTAEEIEQLITERISGQLILPEIANEASTTLMGTAGDDYLYANFDQNAQILGYGGSDTVVGSDLNDFLVGGRGDDTIEGGAGDDVYYYSLGDGSDYIANYDDTPRVDSERNDRILFAEDISLNDIEIRKNDIDLEILILPTGDIIRVGFHFYNWDGEYHSEISAIEFSDGLRITPGMIRGILVGATDGDDVVEGFEVDEVIEGYQGNDSVSGLLGDDWLFGNEGDDNLYGNEGNDQLIGGIGNDYMEGGVGNDSYIYHLGDGNDEINTYEDELPSSEREESLIIHGVSSEDVNLAREGYDLIVTMPDGGTVEVAFHFLEIDGYMHSAINRIEFDDQVIWDMNSIGALIIN